jgi:thiamine biosynthesis protein ThiI
MFERAVLVHYHEIGLKGRNRSAFERRLRDNLDAAVIGLTDQRTELISSRLLVRSSDPRTTIDLARRIAVVPGVSSASPCYITSREQHDQDKAALLAVSEAGPFETFAVHSRRSNTDHPVSSMQMNVHIGQAIVDATGKKVDLGNPDVTCSVEVVQGETYVYTLKLPGPGGLPVGTAGKVVSLLSAGIDSPVASWRIMKRGAVVVGVHYSGRPQTDDASEELVARIAEVLSSAGGIGRVYFVPFGDLQKEISLIAPPDLRVLLYRRLMVRVAERIARIEKAKALVTGESLGQVASQTLDNIAAVDEVATMPVLRPLSGSDKLEIIAEARRLGTYALSTQTHTDCCTLFMPRSPATHATVEEVLAAEADLDVGRMVTDALESVTFRDFACRSYRPPRSLKSQDGPGIPGA